MKSLSLYMLSRLRDSASFSIYEKYLSGRDHVKNINSHEQESLCLLVNDIEAALGSEAACASLLDGFYFSYTIQHISKEFDLLKLSKDQSTILNIELKSEAIEPERIRDQLLQNRYYLRHISRKIYSFTYVSQTRTLFTLNNHDYLVATDMQDLIKSLRDPSLKRSIDQNIDAYFETAGYQISPINQPQRFLSEQYFLTNQQWDIRRKVTEIVQSGKRPACISVSGSVGTGKTLLLYDLALQFSRHHKVCILHCGPLSRGHRTIDRRLRNVTIQSPDEVFAQGSAAKSSLSIYDCEYLLIDETARLTASRFQKLVDLARNQHQICIYAYDPERFIFADTNGEQLWTQMQTAADYAMSLSGNIRINQGLAAFRRCLFNLNTIPSSKYPMQVLVLYASSDRDEKMLLALMQEKGYSIMKPDAIELASREPDKVVVTIDNRFHYDLSGKLTFGRSKEENRKACEDLYDRVSRAREDLCIIVRENLSLFNTLIGLLNET